MQRVFFGLFAVISVSLMFIGIAANNQPDVIHVERAVQIQAPAADVFPFANDYANWGAWDPWRKKDPNQKTTLSETTAGVGAWTAWDGNDEVGKGKMSILESVDNEKVVQKLEFFEPFEAEATATLTLTENEKGTRVVWSFDQPQDFPSKVFTLFMDMDKMLGPDFSTGLKSLKKASEGARKTREEAEAAAQAEADALRAALEATAADDAAPE